MDKIEIPLKGRDKNEIMDDLRSFCNNDPDYKGGKTWSLVYYLNEGHSNFMNDAYSLYSSSNGLNPTAFKSLKKIETEVIRITADLFHGDENVCGVMTSGGTESCLLAVKTYRDYGRAKKRIKKPEMIIAETAHVAWLKGAEYFGVKPVIVPLDKNEQIDIKSVSKKINRNTVMILGSAPEYPHGIIDNIEVLGELGLKHNIPVHVDACVGGFILPFLEKIGKEIPLWDYRIPGVTSISADIHKYGFAAKGASTITYRNLEILKHQMFVHQDWPGGVFASPALLGTRPGGAYAAAWAAIHCFGEEGYIELAKKVMEVSDDLKQGITEIPDLEIIGNPVGPLFAYRSTTPDVNIFAVGDQMEQRGWHIDRLQMPEALHAMVTPNHEPVIESYVKDLGESVQHVREHPELAETGGAATYGMIAHVPFRKMVGKQVLELFSSMYGPGGGVIDVNDSSITENMNTGENSTTKPILERVIQKYVSYKTRKG